MEVCDKNFMKSILGTRHRRWALVPYVGRSGGVLIYVG